MIAFAEFESLMMAFGTVVYNSSLVPHRIQRLCLVVIARAVYSASQVDVATDFCLPQSWEIVESPS
jgi:putative copper export protein